jgi:hypothetical protein
MGSARRPVSVAGSRSCDPQPPAAADTHSRQRACRSTAAAQSGSMNITALQFGIYRDGDNNLDTVQSPVIDQAFRVSAADGRIAFNVEDTTARHDLIARGGERTETYDIRDGQIASAPRIDAPHDPSSRANLARFVARTLDAAQRTDAKQTWIDLVDHGGGDGGGLQSDTHGSVMSSTDIAGAIADGIAMHAHEHPDDAGRRLDGVAANQCLMSTLGFSDALSHDGVKWLAASPETMLAPGTPTSVAEDIAKHVDDPDAMAKAVVKDTMGTQYGTGRMAYKPAAAMDVLDLDPKKFATMRDAVKTLDRALTSEVRNSDSAQNAVLDDANSVDGMVRFDKGTLPWHADRPAIALYDAFASDARLSSDVRSAATAASKAVGDIVLAHAESRGFAPFGGADYRDAVGPTVHFATDPKQLDPWAPKISETHTAFYREVGAAKLDRALLA